MIEIKNLIKKYGKHTALSDVTVSFRPEEITAIVGPNGSGKTTLIKAILGLIGFNSGSIIISNHQLNGNPIYRKDIGYMPQIPNYPENLTVNDLMKMLKDLREEKKFFDDELYDDLEIQKYSGIPIKNLSGGTKQKINAILAFMFNPSLLILDEPTASLDPISSSLLKNKIVKQNSSGNSIILTSHNMSEIEELASNIVFLLEGRIYFDGLVSELKRISNEDKLERAVATIMKENKS